MLKIEVALAGNAEEMLLKRQHTEIKNQLQALTTELKQTEASLNDYDEDDDLNRGELESEIMELEDKIEELTEQLEVIEDELEELR